MSRLFHPLLLLIANSTEHRLARHVQYLSEELSILRARLPQEIHTTKAERARLLKFGKPLGKDIDRLIQIVTPGTFRRWVREERRGYFLNRPGRPSKRKVLRELVLKIAGETGMGYTRILDELRRLGIYKICRQTVRNILKKEGFDTSPRRANGTWDEFLAVHAKTLWACDFLNAKVLTRRGFFNFFILAFINLETRKIYVAPATLHPDAEWVERQARFFLMDLEDNDEKATHLIHDRDTKFTAKFDALFESEDIETVKLPIRSPNLNARCERVIQTLKQECLNNFLICGEKHLNYLVREFVRYYNEHRAHSSREFLPPSCSDPPPENETIVLNQIVRHERLGGLIK